MSDKDSLWEQFSNGTDEQARQLAGWMFGYLWDQDKFWDAVEAFFAKKGTNQ